MKKIRLNGVEYEVGKALNRVPVGLYLELEEQTGIDLDVVDAGVASGLHWRKWLGCVAFLLRRNAGEDVTYADVVADLIPEDVIVDEPEAPPDPPEAGDAQPPSET